MTNLYRQSRQSQNVNRRRSIRRGGAPFVARVETAAEKQKRITERIASLKVSLGAKAYLKDGVTECAVIRHLRDELAEVPVQLYQQPFRPEGCKTKVSPPKGKRANGTVTCVSTTADQNQPEQCSVNPKTNRCKRV